MTLKPGRRLMSGTCAGDILKAEAQAAAAAAHQRLQTHSTAAETMLQQASEALQATAASGVLRSQDGARGGGCHLA